MGSFEYEDLEDDLCKCVDNNDSFAEFCRGHNVDLVQFRKEWLCGGFRTLRKKCRGSLYNLLSWQEYVLLHANCVSDAVFVDWLNFIPDNVNYSVESFLDLLNEAGDFIILHYRDKVTLKDLAIRYNTLVSKVSRQITYGMWKFKSNSFKDLLRNNNIANNLSSIRLFNQQDIDKIINDAKDEWQKSIASNNKIKAPDAWKKLGLSSIDGLEVRAYNILVRSGKYHTLYDLAVETDNNFMKTRNLGKRALENIHSVLDYYYVLLIV